MAAPTRPYALTSWQALGSGPPRGTPRFFRRAKGWALGLAVAAVAAANSLVALHIVSASAQPPIPTGADSAVHYYGKVSTLPPAPTPVTIPPVDELATPAPSGGDSSPSLQVSQGPGAVAPTVNGTPVDITDPSTVAQATVASLPLFQYPGAAAPETSLANPNRLGAPLVLLVTAFQPGWVQAYVPLRPNEATAWVPASDVSINSVPCHIAIGIGAHKLVLYCHNTAVFEAPVATGAPDSPTPTGSYFVAYMVKLTDPWNVYGPYAMGLSAFSNTYFSFEGGPGQIGIHGTNQPWVIGSYASHGCIRLNNADITALAAQVLPGTPVEIGA